MDPKVSRFLLFVLVLGLCVSVSLPLRAQVSGATLSGAVTDAQGGVVAGAKVAVRNLNTGILVETTTNSAGAYTVPNLNPSDYEVRVSSTGFTTAVSKVTLTVGAKQELNISLAVGEMSTTVEVAAVAPQIELTSSTISDEVTATTMRELPLNGRDWASLATLQPSVVEARTHLDVTHVGGGGGRGFGDQLSIGGGRPTQNSYRLDGAIVNDYSNAGPGSVLGKNLGVDAVQEFSVLTGNYSAEYGFTSGGVINAITKSGTNTFHGTAFEFLRNDKLDAADFFANLNGLGKNALRQNQFGAAGGWKVLKDKAFLFGNYEGVRLAAGLPVSSNVTISDAVRNGTVANLSCPTGTPGCTSTVTVASIDPNIQKYLALFPHAGSAVNANTAHAPFLGHRAAGENFFTTRGDYKLSDKDSIFATYLRDTSDFNSPLTFNDVQQGFTSYRQAIIVEETHVFSTSFTNTVRGGLDRTNNYGGNSPIANNPAANDPSLAQLPGFFSSQIALTGTGVTTLPGGKNYAASIQDFWGQIRQLYDDAFYSHGNHSLKFGFSVLAQQVDGYTPLAGGNGSATYSSRGFYNAGNGSQTPTAAEAGCLKPGYSVGDQNSTHYDASCGALVNLLTNQPLSATRTVDLSFVKKHYLRDKIFGVYFQDDWRIRPSLTLNLGLRYEMSTIPTEKYGKVADIPTPTTLLPCGGGPPTCATADPTSVLSNVFFTHNPTLKNFEPRIGFAWDPFHNGKTSVRGGFGIFDALPLPYELILNNNSSAPWRQTYAPLGPTGGGLQSSPPSIAGGTATNAQGEWPYVIPSLTSVHNLSPLSRSFMYVEPTPKRNYVYQYNLNIQRQITPTLSLLIGYTGSHALHNPFQADTINTVVPTKDPTTGLYYWPKTYTLTLPTTVKVGGTAPPTAIWGDAADPCPALGVLPKQPQNCFLLNTTTASGMYNTDWQARSWYNAMQIKLDKRLSHGFQIQAAYTWSKSIDDSSGSTAGDTFQLDIVSEPWYDMSLNKGLSDFDVRHNFVINGLWNVPTPKTMGAFGEKALGGWQLGIITTIASGVPESASMTAFNNAADIAGEIITTNQPPNVVSGCSPQGLVAPNYRHTLIYLKVNCLSLVPQTAANAAFCDSSRTPGNTCANIRGNLGRDTIIGPGLFDMDFSVFKNNYVRKISETFNVQFRAEMFNVLNHANFAPSANLNPFLDTLGTPDPTFGQLTQTQVPNRQIQLALKMIW